MHTLSLSAVMPFIISKWHPVVTHEHCNLHIAGVSAQCSHICIIKHAQTNIFRVQWYSHMKADYVFLALVHWYHFFFFVSLFPAEASSSSLAGILCGIAVAGVAAVAGYFTYRKKKLCFQNRQGNYLAE